MKILIILINLCCIFTNTAFSKESTYDKCYELASSRYEIDHNLLKSIAIIESANISDVISKKNSDGTHDIGLMQINSSWLKELSQFGIDKNDLLHPCTNIQVGAWVLAQEIARFGYTWDAVGAYNAGPASNRETLRKVYADRVKKVYFTK